MDVTVIAWQRRVFSITPNQRGCNKSICLHIHIPLLQKKYLILAYLIIYHIITIKCNMRTDNCKETLYLDTVTACEALPSSCPLSEHKENKFHHSIFAFLHSF